MEISNASKKDISEFLIVLHPTTGEMHLTYLHQPSVTSQSWVPSLIP